MILAGTVVFCLAAAPLRMVVKPLRELEKSMLGDRITADINSISIYRNGLQSTLSFMIPSLETLRPEGPHEVNVPPNEILKLFDREFGTPDQQMDLVLFLDGYERKEMALEASLEECRQSWKRPKWHILVQDEPEVI